MKLEAIIDAGKEAFHRLPKDPRISGPANPFTTDGCSGFMSFLWRQVLCSPPPWEGLCIEHDRAYWIGGERSLRLEADKTLMRGVIENGHPYWAILIFISVRVGGVSWLPFPSIRQVNGHWRLFFNGVRWGYGWPYPRYKP